MLTVLISGAGTAYAEQNVVLEIKGMSWKRWPLAIKKSLSGTEGVKSVEISYKKRKAWLVVDVTVSGEILLKAVANSEPFSAIVLKRVKRDK